MLKIGRKYAKSLNRKQLVLICLVGISIIAMVVVSAALLGVFTLGPHDVPEPIDIDEKEHWSDNLEPGGETRYEFVITHGVNNSENNRTYSGIIRLTDFEDVTGETGLEALGTSPGTHITELSIEFTGDSIPASYRQDFLNDGIVHFRNLPPRTKKYTEEYQDCMDYWNDEDKCDDQVEQKYEIVWHNRSVTFGVRAEKSSPPGRFNATLEVDRMIGVPGSGTDMHDELSDRCGECHNAKKSVSVHRQTVDDRECIECHQNSMEDLHMNCLAGCHDSYPIGMHQAGLNEDEVQNVTNVPFGDQLTESAEKSYTGTNDCGTCHDKQAEIVAGYTCGQEASFCHDGRNDDYHSFNSDESRHPNNADKLGLTHKSAFKYTTGSSFCGKCHSDSIMDLHGNFSRSCPDCHGLTLQPIHEEYEATGEYEDCPVCHDSA